jgi:hypothetical protein
MYIRKIRVEVEKEARALTFLKALTTKEWGTVFIKLPFNLGRKLPQLRVERILKVEFNRKDLKIR